MPEKIMSNPEDQPALFDLFPSLREKISWIALGFFPTPVHRLEEMGCSNLWIKRDDLDSKVYGGNKVRKLEFVLADAVERKKRRVITMGGIGTNHGLATAIYCHRLGLACTLLLFYQPVTKYVKQNMLLFHRYNAEMVYTKGMLRTGLNFYLPQKIRHPRSYFLYAGGSSPIGTLGFVNAVFELKKQIEDGLMPVPKYIFCPLGSNGTMAGLALGCLLAGLDSTVIGVRVAASYLGPLQLTTPGTVKSLMEKTYNLLKANSKEIPDIKICTPQVLNEYFGQGYGYPTKEGLHALRVLKDREDIPLDPTYTSKAFAAVIDFINDRRDATDPILYWHTYNSVDLSSETRSIDYHDLPGEFHQFFEGEEIPV